MITTSILTSNKITNKTSNKNNQWIWILKPLVVSLVSCDFKVITRISLKVLLFTSIECIELEKNKHEFIFNFELHLSAKMG